MDVPTYMLEGQVSEENDLELNEEEDIRFNEIREYHWMDVDEEGEDKKKIHALRWEVYVNDKEDLLKREF